MFVFIQSVSIRLADFQKRRRGFFAHRRSRAHVVHHRIDCSPPANDPESQSNNLSISHLFINVYSLLFTYTFPQKRLQSQLCFVLEKYPLPHGLSIKRVRGAIGQLIIVTKFWSNCVTDRLKSNCVPAFRQNVSYFKNPYMLLARTLSYPSSLQEKSDNFTTITRPGTSTGAVGRGKLS